MKSEIVYEENEIEKIISASESLKDTVQLRSYFVEKTKNLPPAQKTMLECVHKIRLAQVIADHFEDINNQSTALFKEAINNCPHQKNCQLHAWILTQFGFYFYSFSQYGEALPYFEKASKILDNITFDRNGFLMLGETYMKNAFFLGTLGNQTQMLSYLNSALEYTSPSSKNYGTILAAIGMCYFQDNDFAKAMHYHEETIEYALRINDSVRYAKAMGEIAQIHIIQKNYDEAEALLKEDILVSKIYNADRNTMFAQILLGKLYLTENNTEMASKSLSEAYIYARSKPYLKSFEYQIAELLLQIAQQKGDKSQELDLLRNLKALQPILSKTDGDEAINRINLKSQKDKFDYQLQLETAKREKETLRKTTYGIIAVLLFVAIGLVYSALRRKLKIKESEYQHMVQSLQLDKVNSEIKLMDTHNSLIAYQTYLLEKNEQISRLEKEIQLMSGSRVFNKERNNHELEKLLQSHMLTDESWQKFKNAFIREDYETYKSLLEQFPTITESALRIELLQSLGLNNAETARILGVTIEAVKKSKQRLRRKSALNFS